MASARNADLLRILEEVIVPGDNRTVCENRGFGIRVVVAAAAATGLPTPIFRDKVTAFEVVLRNAPAGAGVPGGAVRALRARHGLATTSRIHRARDILDMIRARGEASRAEIAADLGLTQRTPHTGSAGYVAPAVGDGRGQNRQVKVEPAAGDHADQARDLSWVERVPVLDAVTARAVAVVVTIWTP